MSRNHHNTLKKGSINANVTRVPSQSHIGLICIIYRTRCWFVPYKIPIFFSYVLNENPLPMVNRLLLGPQRSKNTKSLKIVFNGVGTVRSVVYSSLMSLKNDLSSGMKS